MSEKVRIEFLKDQIKYLKDEQELIEWYMNKDKTMADSWHEIYMQFEKDIQKYQEELEELNKA